MCEKKPALLVRWLIRNGIVMSSLLWFENQQSLLVQRSHRLRLVEEYCSLPLRNQGQKVVLPLDLESNNHPKYSPRNHSMIRPMIRYTSFDRLHKHLGLFHQTTQPYRGKNRHLQNPPNRKFLSGLFSECDNIQSCQRSSKDPSMLSRIPLFLLAEILFVSVGLHHLGHNQPEQVSRITGNR